MGISIRELREFLVKLPTEMDDYEMVNGEISDLIDGQYYTRVDKPIIQIQVDEQTKEFLCLHQTEEEIGEIISKLGENEDGDSSPTT